MNASKITAAKANAAALGRRIATLNSRLPYATGTARTGLLRQIAAARRAHSVAAAR